MKPIQHRITRWEYIQQSCREVFVEHGITRMAPQNMKEWDELVKDSWQIATTVAHRMGDLFYNFESDFFRESLSPEESRIASRSDINHEERKREIYFLRCASYIRRLRIADAQWLKTSLAKVSSGDSDERPGLEPVRPRQEPLTPTSFNSLPISLGITKEDRIIAERIGIVLE